MGWPETNPGIWFILNLALGSFVQNTFLLVESSSSIGWDAEGCDGLL